MRLLTGIGFFSHPSRCSEGLLSTSGKLQRRHIVLCLYSKRLLMKHLFGGLHQVIFFLPLSSATHPALITWSTPFFQRPLILRLCSALPKAGLKWVIEWNDSICQNKKEKRKGSLAAVFHPEGHIIKSVHACILGLTWLVNLYNTILLYLFCYIN